MCLLQAARLSSSRMQAVISAIAVGDKVNPFSIQCSCIAEDQLVRFANGVSKCLQLPSDPKFNYFDADGNMQEVKLEDLTKGKKVCCTPMYTCEHLPTEYCRLEGGVTCPWTVKGQ